MTEEAREAAMNVDLLANIIRTVDGDHTAGAGAIADGIADSGFLAAIHAAGVAEGIRIAKEALATTDPTWPRGMYGSPDDMYAKIAIQRAFEWLETTD